LKGRRRDSAEMQAAKGAPGKRMSAAERQLAEAEVMANELAAAPPLEADILAPPNILDGKRFAGALRIWREYAPLLNDRRAFDSMFRDTFSHFCVWQALAEMAKKDIDRYGLTRLVKTTSKDKALKRNPAIDILSEATTRVMQLSERFGFTPLDRYKLEQQHQAWSSRMPAQPPGELPLSAPGQRDTAALSDDVIGIGGSLDGTPPQRVN